MPSINEKSFFTRQPQTFSKKQITSSTNKKTTWMPTRSALLAGGILTALGGIYWAYHRNSSNAISSPNIITKLTSNPFGMATGIINAMTVVGSGIFIYARKNTIPTEKNTLAPEKNIQLAEKNVLPPEKNETLPPKFLNLFNTRDKNNEISRETAMELRGFFSFVKNEEEKCSMWNQIALYLSTSNVSADDNNQAYDTLYCDLVEYLENQLNHEAKIENSFAALLNNSFDGLIKYSPLIALKLAIQYYKIENNNQIDKNPETLKILSKIISTYSENSNYKIPFTIECLKSTEEFDETTKELLQDKIVELLRNLTIEELCDVLNGCIENKQLVTKILEKLYEPDDCENLLKSMYNNDSSSPNQPSESRTVVVEKENSSTESKLDPIMSLHPNVILDNDKSESKDNTNVFNDKEINTDPDKALHSKLLKPGKISAEDFIAASLAETKSKSDVSKPFDSAKAKYDKGCINDNPICILQ